jgi:hypothetical protein
LRYLHSAKEGSRVRSLLSLVLYPKHVHFASLTQSAKYGGPVDVSYVGPQAHGIINVALQWEYSLGIIFIFFQGRKDLYHV